MDKAFKNIQKNQNGEEVNWQDIQWWDMTDGKFFLFYNSHFRTFHRLDESSWAA